MGRNREDGIRQGEAAMVIASGSKGLKGCKGTMASFVGGLRRGGAGGPTMGEGAEERGVVDT